MLRWAGSPSGFSPLSTPFSPSFSSVILALMIRFASLFLLALTLAACTSTPVQQEDDGSSSTPSRPGGQSQSSVPEGPLRVPALSALPETPARPLAGRFTQANWADLPGYASDDMADLWPLFVRNCKGLMRPTGGSLTTPARSAPRAWQPVCAAAADPARAPAAGAAARRLRRVVMMKAPSSELIELAR